MAHDPCYISLKERRRLEERIRQARTEIECLRVAKEIYQFIEAYPERSKAFLGKRITIAPAFWRTFKSGQKLGVIKAISRGRGKARLYTISIADKQTEGK